MVYKKTGSSTAHGSGSSGRSPEANAPKGRKKAIFDTSLKYLPYTCPVELCFAEFRLHYLPASQLTSSLRLHHLLPRNFALQWASASPYSLIRQLSPRLHGRQQRRRSSLRMVSRRRLPAYKRPILTVLQQVRKHDLCFRSHELVRYLRHLHTVLQGRKGTRS